MVSISVAAMLTVPIFAFAEPTDGLVDYWNFDETSGTTASDSSGSNITGTLQNNPTWTTGKIGGALRFDGLNDYVITSAPAITATDNWTIAAWINPANINQYGVVLHNGKEIGSTGDGYSLGISNGAASGTGAVLTGIANGLAAMHSGYTFPSANAWYHVVMLRSSGGYEVLCQRRANPEHIFTSV